MLRRVSKDLLARATAWEQPAFLGRFMSSSGSDDLMTVVAEKIPVEQVRLKPRRSGVGGILPRSPFTSLDPDRYALSW